MTEQQRMEPKARRVDILAAALELAKTVGYRNIKREDVAKRAGCSTGLVNHYYGTMASLQSDVMRAAVKQGVLAVIAQGIVAGDCRAKSVPDTIRQQALASLA